MKSITSNQQVMKKGFFLLIFLFLLNGCAESVALLGSSVGGASSGKMLQSSLNSAISYGIKQQTGKTPLGHVLAYADEKNPEKKQETCISFIERTRSEFCTILNKQISLTNTAVKEKTLEVKEKTLEIVKKYPKKSPPQRQKNIKHDQCNRGGIYTCVGEQLRLLERLS